MRFSRARGSLKLSSSTKNVLDIIGLEFPSTETTEEAADLDPEFAEAYAWLGSTYWLRWFYGWNPTVQTIEHAGELAQRAIALDDSLSMPHRVLSNVYVWKKQHDQALAESEQALALDPHDAEGYFAFGAVLVFSGRPEEGIGLIK